MLLRYLRRFLDHVRRVAVRRAAAEQAGEQGEQQGEGGAVHGVTRSISFPPAIDGNLAATSLPGRRTTAGERYGCIGGSADRPGSAARPADVSR